jgi:hypothetical protein
VEEGIFNRLLDKQSDPGANAKGPVQIGNSMRKKPILILLISGMLQTKPVSIK